MGEHKSYFLTCLLTYIVLRRTRTRQRRKRIVEFTLNQGTVKSSFRRRFRLCMLAHVCP